MVTAAKKTTTRKNAGAKSDAKRPMTRRPVSQTTSTPDTAEVVHSEPPPKISLEEEHRIAQGLLAEIEEEQVTVVVPKRYTLTPTQGQAIDYEAGTQEMPISHAHHWWSRANGVKIYVKQ